LLANTRASIEKVKKLSMEKYFRLRWLPAMYPVEYSCTRKATIDTMGSISVDSGLSCKSAENEKLPV
jgi:hypothetical protein